MKQLKDLPEMVADIIQLLDEMTGTVLFRQGVMFSEAENDDGDAVFRSCGDVLYRIQQARILLHSVGQDSQALVQAERHFKNKKAAQP